MTVTIAIVILLALIEAAQLVLTVGIIRRLKVSNMNVTLQPTSGPRSGWIVKLEADAEVDPWPAEADAMLDGVCMVAFVQHDCPACHQLRRDLSKTNLGVPLYVVGEEQWADTDNLNEWPHLTRAFTRNVPFDMLNSFDNPAALPMIAVIKGGVVLQSGYRLADVSTALGDAAETTTTPSSAFAS